MFWLVKQVVIGLFCFGDFYVNAPGHTKCISLNNQQCRTQLIVNLHPNDYIEGLHYYPSVVNIHAWEDVILLMIYSAEYVFQLTQKI